MQRRMLKKWEKNYQKEDEGLDKRVMDMFMKEKQERLEAEAAAEKARLEAARKEAENEKLPEEIYDWTTRHVEIWMKKSGGVCIRYVEKFKEEAVDGDALAGFAEEEEDLKDYGVEKPSHRRQISKKSTEASGIAKEG